MRQAGGQEVFGLQLGLLDPRLQCVPSDLGDFKLHRALGLVLHDDGARGQLIAVTPVADPEGDEVATSKRAVDAQVEEGPPTPAVLHLKPNPARSPLSVLTWNPESRLSVAETQPAAPAVTAPRQARQGVHYVMRDLHEVLIPGGYGLITLRPQFVPPP